MNLECTALCKFSLIGCPRRKCGFAHDPSELKARMCPHKSKCRFDRRSPNLKAHARPCGMFHPGEETTPEEVYKRAVEFAKPIEKDDVFRCTRFCRFLKTHCPKRKSGECTHAHTDDEVRPLICPFESYCIGAACRFPFHGEAIDREKMLAYARDVQFDELPEPLARSMVVRPWSDDDDEELDMSAEPEYNIVTMTQVSRELKKVKEAKAAAKAAEEAKEEDMDLTPEADDEYARPSDADEKKKLAKIVMENFELFQKHAKWVMAMIQ
jgi:hypothetical protein